MSIEIRDYTDNELKAIPPITLDPGELGADGIRRGRTLRNPFLPDGQPAEDEPRATLARRWSQLHWNKPSALAPAFDMADPLDALMERLDVIDGKTRNLWHEVRNVDGALVAVHPLVCRDVADWESGLAALMQSQTLVLPPERPGQPFQTEPVAERTEPRRFEDSDESKRMRGLTRGD